MKRPSSEVSVLRVQFLKQESDFAGGLIALSGLELRKARMADTEALWMASEESERAGLLQRMANAAHLFPPVAEDEFYLSKMGLNARFRGKGLGRALVQRFLEEGWGYGFERYRLDVHVGNEPAIHCYSSLGFEVFHTGQTADGSLQYCSMRYPSTIP